jgi:acylglycerol lipase
MNHVEGAFDGVGSTQLFWQGWLPDAAPRAVIFVAHGLAEHSGRYRNLVDHVVPRGYAVYALDHRGHGRSEGTRSYIERFTDFTTDLDTFRRVVRARHPTGRLFLLGHSMGGAIALVYACDHQHQIDGLMLSGAAAGARRRTAVVTRTISCLAGSVAPRLGVFRLPAATVSSDPAVVAEYDADPLVYRGRIPARTIAELYAAARRVRPRVRCLCLPVLILHGSADELVPADASRALAMTVGSEDVSLHIYGGFAHEVLNEAGRDRVLRDIECWLAAHV